ncbi:MAG: hypothetical protein WBZ19_06055 [Chthoniobacterales bacterium]
MSSPTAFELPTNSIFANTPWFVTSVLLARFIEDEDDDENEDDYDLLATPY